MDHGSTSDAAAPQPRPAVTAESAAHLSLMLGRLLLENGADTTQVQETTTRFAAGLGFDVRLFVSGEALMLTVIGPTDFRTKIGRHVPAMKVDMAAVEALHSIVEDIAADRAGPDEAEARLEAVAGSRALYPAWAVALALGLTAASLARLFGGDWHVCAAAGAAGTVGTLIRQLLGRWHANAVATAFLVALASGLVGAFGVMLLPGRDAALCLIAPGMILVPGVPLINGIRDGLGNHMALSITRLGSAALVVLAISLGLLVAERVSGIAIPVAGPAPLMPVAQDFLFSALAAFGYGLLFNVRPRVVWACVLCGMAGHGLRTAALHLGLDIASATLVGSLVAGLVACACAWSFNVPAATFAFPGVVAMVPGSYAFRAVLGCLGVMRLGGTAPLIGETLSLLIITAILIIAIAVGLAVPLAIPLPRKHCNGVIPSPSM